MKKIWLIILIVIILLGVKFLMMRNNRLTRNINSHPDWQTSSLGSGFEFKYPKTFSGNVRSPEVWPPAVTMVSKTKDPIENGCPDLKQSADFVLAFSGETSQGVKYLLYQGNGAGAGTLYSQYCYVIQGSDNYYILDFLIRSHTGCGGGSCGAYCGTQFEQECRDLDRIKAIENPINNIVSSFVVHSYSTK